MAWSKDSFGKEAFKPQAFHSSFSSGFDNGFHSSAFNSTSVAMNGASSSQQRRSFTSPKKQQFDDFANFADFNNISFPSDPSWDVPETSPQKPLSPPPPQQSQVGHMRSVFEEKTSPQQQQQPPPRSIKAASSSAVYTDTSLSELLAQAKSKSTSRNRRSGNSVNSAPVTSLSAAYLRQHHNLKPRSSDRNIESPRPSQESGGTSVSDIIHSLEAANASRQKVTTSNTTLLNNSMGSGSRNRPSRSGGELDTLSVHSRDNASVRSAKERLRHRREQRQNRNSDSSESDENGSESWLIDEVTGALGPRGIAPDLESLSGRSNRSRSSGGGRSHKSHKSHRSHRSSRRSSNRRHKSSSGASGDSVSSHGSRRSRGSRHSRSSRYSHRSTRSYLSQMSEQSRSVANDLLRLEMQLAMVGSGNDDARRATNSHASSARHSSRTSRTSRRANAAAARRARMTIIAPPGKLGIILANKADSRGTVVSGVRTSSVMAEQISPGDRIVAIDGEDVSLMTVSEITTIMTRKADFERTLTVLTTPRHSEPLSPRSSSDYDYLYTKN
jgi:hypothetical protein